MEDAIFGLMGLVGAIVGGWYFVGRTKAESKAQLSAIDQRRARCSELVAKTGAMLDHEAPDRVTWLGSSQGRDLRIVCDAYRVSLRLSLATPGSSQTAAIPLSVTPSRPGPRGDLTGDETFDAAVTVRGLRQPVALGMMDHAGRASLLDFVTRTHGEAETRTYWGELHSDYVEAVERADDDNEAHWQGLLERMLEHCHALAARHAAVAADPVAALMPIEAADPSEVMRGYARMALLQDVDAHPSVQTLAQEVLAGPAYTLPERVAAADALGPTSYPTLAAAIRSLAADLDDGSADALAADIARLDLAQHGDAAIVAATKAALQAIQAHRDRRSPGQLSIADAHGGELSLKPHVE